MILEAFSKYLRQADPQMHATEVLGLWLTERLLSTNKIEKNPVDKVIQCEITVDVVDSESMNLSKNEQDIQSTRPLLVPQENLAQIAPDMGPEITALKDKNQNQALYVFKGTSQSGDRLLKSLVEYCLSIEHQKWARFVHSLKASDFKQLD